MPDVPSDTIHAHGLLCSSSPRTPNGWLELGPGLVVVPLQPADESGRRVLSALIGLQLLPVRLAAIGHATLGVVTLVLPVRVVTLRVIPIELVTFVVAVDLTIGCAALVAPPVRRSHAGR